MEPFRVRLKVGPHEFEAEGDQESVERQLAIWRELIASPSAAPAPAPAILPPATLPPISGTINASLPPLSGGDSRADYDRLFRHDGRVVSLTVLPNSNGDREADAALLVLLGQKVFNSEDLVTGAQILEGLKQSGMLVPRADRVFGEHMDVNVMRIGAHRSVKYRLTNQGLARARELAQSLLALVA